MKKLTSILSIYALAASLCTPALASTGTIQKADVYEGGKNVLTNASFDYPTYNKGWTITTATGAKETVNVKDGKQAASLTFSASTGDIAQSVTPVINTNSQNWEASCQVKTTVSTISVCAIVNGVESCPTTSNVSASGNWNMGTMNFIGPTDGQSVGVRVKTTASATGTVYVDDCYVGAARNLSQVSQAQIIGTAKLTGCTAAHSNSSTTLATLGTQTSCSYALTGAALQPSTNVMGVKFASLPPGEYEISYEGTLEQTTQGKQAYFQFTDGTNTARELSTYSTSTGGDLNLNGLKQTFTLTTASSSPTWELYGKTDSGGAVKVFGTTSFPGVIVLKYFPSQSQTALRPDATPASWYGFTNGGASWSTLTNGSYVDPTVSGTPTLTARGTPRNITCSQSGTNPAVSCTLPRQGNYLLVANAQANNNTLGDAADLQLVDGSGTVIATALHLAENNTGYRQQTTLTGGYYASNSGTYIFKIQLKATGGGTAALGSSGAANPIEWSIVELDAPMSAPYLVGSVTSNTSGQERVERAVIGVSGTACTTATCSIASQSGSWITSATRSAAGSYTLNFAAGIFSSAPSCTVSILGATYVAWNVQATTSALAVTTGYPNAGSGVNVDSTFNVICMGPR